MKIPSENPMENSENCGPRHVLNDAGHDVDGCTEEGTPPPSGVPGVDGHRTGALKFPEIGMLAKSC